MFGKKQTQAEKDHAFLAAVGAHKFARAEKLLKRGASPQVVDDEGNTAFHYLAGAKKYIHQSQIGVFVELLCLHGVDLNARNKMGLTCLHKVPDHPHPSELYHPTIVDSMSMFGGVFRCSSSVFLSMMFDRGADMAATDAEGRTVLHLYAQAGDRMVVQELLKIAPQLVKLRDALGRYPHMSAVSGPVKHVDLARDLENFFKTQHEDFARPAVTPVPDDQPWILMNKPACVARISEEPAIGYRLTEIFNFAHNTYTCITHNFETRVDSNNICGFDTFADKAAIERARQALSLLNNKPGGHKIDGGL